MWERDIPVAGAYALNAISAAESTLAVILFSLKHGERVLGDRDRIQRVGARDADVPLPHLVGHEGPHRTRRVEDQAQPWSRLQEPGIHHGAAPTGQDHLCFGNVARE